MGGLVHYHVGVGDFFGSISLGDDVGPTDVRQERVSICFRGKSWSNFIFLLLLYRNRVF